MSPAEGSVKIAVVSNIDNGAGLQRDWELVRALAEEAGHEVVGLHYQKSRPASVGTFDLMICLEVLGPRFVSLARRTWLVPNLEYLPVRADISAFDRVLVKTRHTERALADEHPGVVFTGWSTHDLFDAAIARERACLHVWGLPTHKGGQAVCAAWTRHHQRLPPLTIVARHAVPRGPWTIRYGVDDAELRRLINQSAIIVQPSIVEGFGVIHREALSVGALLVTTDGPPMNELAAVARCVRARSGHAFHRSPTWHVEPEELAAAVLELDTLEAGQVDARREAARAYFLAERHQFRAHVLDLLATEAELLKTLI